ncbi:ATP12 family chaperone protein [Litorimonas haliclonae]|uniref:ATP12 family chaperone protein n=1 Tax=Litorimonas haliclonae TaxID=2081977 RepID=UPI0039EFAC47
MANRFYKSVSTREISGRFHVLLDERVLKTPGKMAFCLPTELLAKAVAKEWDAQTDKIEPAKMPVTRLLNVALEQTPSRRPELLEEAKRYTSTDLLCYRAPEPRILVERQSEGWDGWLAWAKSRGVDLVSTQSLIATVQPESAYDSIAAYAEGLDDIRLTLFMHFTAVFGSVVLAMAVIEKALTAGEAFDLSRLDILYQNELWGEDEEAAEIARDLRNETVSLGTVLDLL